MVLAAPSLVFDSRGAVHTVSPEGEGAASLVTAFAAAENGDEIVLEPGTYEIDPAYPAGAWNAPLQLRNKTNITLRGAEGEEAAEVFTEGQGELIILYNCSAIRFDNVTFRSTRAPVVPTNGLYSTIMLYGPNEKLTFENCKFLDFGNHAISQLFGRKQSTDVIVRNCFFADGGDLDYGDGAAVSGIGSRWLIESNRVERCLFAFEIEGPWGTNQNITVRRNTIINPRGCGVVIFATSGRSSDFSDIEISDNLIKDGVRDPVRPLFPAGILVGGGERVQVLRNRIENCEGSGILARAQWAELRDSVIAGNIVTNAGFNGILVDEFQNNFLATNVLVQSNIVSTTGQAGITVAGVNVRVQGNTIENSGWLGTYGGVEVKDAQPTESIRIEGNIIRNQGTAFQDYGVWVHPEARGTVIGPNQFRANTLEAIHDEGTNTVTETWILNATLPTPESGATVTIFAPPGTEGRLEASGDLEAWTDVESFLADPNGEASVVVPAEMTTDGKRYFRAAY